MQQVLDNLRDLPPTTGAKDIDLLFLRGIIESPIVRSLAKAHERLADVKLEAVRDNNQQLVSEILDSLTGLSSRDASAEELANILQEPHFKSLIEAHDKVAAKCYEMPPSKVNSNAMATGPLMPADAVRMIGIQKKAGEPLGVTFRVERGELVIARILHGSMIDRQGMLHAGDVIREVNGRKVGSDPKELLELLKDCQGGITLKILPSYRDTPAPPQVHLKPHFNYSPATDNLIPCKEAGLAFSKGDVLHIVNREDPNWWQAVNIVGGATGLIPSQLLEEKRKAFVRREWNGSGVLCGTLTGKKKKKKKMMYLMSKNAEFDRHELQIYEEVAKMPPFQRKTLVLIGAQGVGRRSLKNRLIIINPLLYGTTVPFTSRPAREEERDGQSYCFVSRSQMEADIKASRYLEHGEYDGNLYGTKMNSIHEVVDAGRTCILDVNPQAETQSTTISQMFAKATKAFVKDTDHEGRLVPVSSLNDTDKLNLRSLIVKTRHRCFWQEPKYQSTGFTLGDVLKPGEPGNTPLSPTVKECDFVDYSGTFGDKKEMNADGNMEAKLADFNLTLGGKWSTKQKLTLGSLNKEKVDVKELHNYSKDRVLDMSHPVIKQTRVNPRAVLGVLTERIMTSLPCPVTNNVWKRGTVGANVSACVFLSGKASMKQSGSTQTDSDVSLGIPANTVMAYSLIELYVKCNGRFELCLIRNNGGFEKVWSKDEIEGDGINDLGGDFAANSPLNLNEELDKLSDHFQLLSALPVAKRSSLLQLLKTTMEDREAVSVLEIVLDQMCDGETPDLGDLEDSERETVQAIVDLVDQCVGKDEDEIRSSLLSAIHLIVSAMDGMPDEGLSVLGSCCSPPVLQALQILVQHVATGSGETLSLRDAGLAVLTEEDVFGRTESLFGHSKVTLKREEDTLRTEMKDQPGYLPLVMSITVKGLASLV